MRWIQAFPGQEGKAYGYPHFHLVLLFRDVEFEVFPHMESSQDGTMGLVFRIYERDELRYQGSWHSFIDVKALSSMRGVLNYCRKYAQGVAHGESDEATLNCAMAWLFRKQSYSLSGSFRGALSEFIRRMQVSKGSWQLDLDGGRIPVWVWSFLGVFSAGELGLGDLGTWAHEISGDLAQELIESRIRRP